MNELKQALEEVRGLHEKILGRPAPVLEPHAFVPFPAGVDPLQQARFEAMQIKEWAEKAAFAPRPDAWLPPADSFVTKDEFVLRLEVPGVSREDLNVFVIGGECVVRGERKPPKFDDELRPMAMERPWGFFERRFALPVGSLVDDMKARVFDGLLELRIPKEGIEGKERKVEVI